MGGTVRGRVTGAARPSRPVVAVAFVTVLAGGLLASCGGSSSLPGATSTSPGGSGAGANVAPAGWTMYGRDLSNSRFDPGETEIDADSVGSLAPSWSTGGLVGVTGTPVVAGRTAFFGDWTGKVRAVDAGTGSPVWTTTVGGDVVGSPAVTASRVFVGVGDALYALDRRTGSVRWKTVTNDNPYSQINGSPVVVGGLVLQGTAQFEEVVGKAPFTFRGSIGAFDAATGKSVWNFVTTPDDATSGAGEGVWSTPAVDPRLGLVYVGTGQNLSPPSGPLADSILAIHLRTGKLAWSHQFNHPDIFSTADFTGKDADVGASPNLWSSGGRTMVGVGSKNGTYYAFDRATGKLAWETFLAPGSTFGGALGSAAVAGDRIIDSSNIGDPSSNASTNTSKVFALDTGSGHIEWAHPLVGNVFGPVSAVPGVAFVGTDAGAMLGLDPATGKVVWSMQAPGKVGGGASIVAGRVLWGYGFTLFNGPGPGGIISLAVSPAGRVHTERGGSTAPALPGG